MPKVHIKYVTLQGGAETTRYVMALGGCEWTESNWSIDMSKMKGGVSALPVACPSFGAAREAGELDGNLGRMPVVVIDGQHTLGQSKSIERCVVVHEH